MPLIRNLARKTKSAASLHENEQNKVIIVRRHISLPRFRFFLKLKKKYEMIASINLPILKHCWELKYRNFSGNVSSMTTVTKDASVVENQFHLK